MAKGEKGKEPKKSAAKKTASKKPAAKAVAVRTTGITKEYLKNKQVCKVTFRLPRIAAPDSNFQQAAIFLYEDTHSYMAINRGYCEPCFPF